MPRPKFPHFTKDEAEVLEAFMKQYPNVQKWEFDVRLKSKKAEGIKFENEMMKLFWEKATAKRIDAVAHLTNEIWLIEVKRYMLSSGIGQLLVYSFMYNEQFKPKKYVKLWLIAKYPDPDVIEVCKKLGIKTWSMY